MALDLPINAPLTETQAELTAKIGSMKSLLALPFNRQINIPKANQISTFDYLLKIFGSIGITPEPLFQFFLSKVFDTTGTFLEEKVLRAIADSTAQRGRDLSSTSSVPINPLNDKTKKTLSDSNLRVLTSVIPATFLTAVKGKIAQDLTLMIFGPQNGASSEKLNSSSTERARLINNAVCGSGSAFFSISNDPIIRDEDIEFNRIKLKKQLENGEVVLEISCQDVKIKMPNDPGIIFNGGGVNTINSSPVTPAQSLSFLISFVNNQTQRINNESNANSAGKTFAQTLIEKLLSYISTLVFPYLDATVFSFLNNHPAMAGLTKDDIVSSPCDIVNNPTDDDKKVFSKSLINSLLKELLKILLIFLIQQFKKLVANYFARTAVEKQKRKLDKIKNRFSLFRNIAENASKIQKYTAAISSLNDIIA